MAKVQYIQYLNEMEAPVKGDEETQEEFDARRRLFWEKDRRIAVDGLGMVNFGFPMRYNTENAIVNNFQRIPFEVFEDGTPKGYTKVDPEVGGWAFPGVQSEESTSSDSGSSESQSN